MKTTLATLVLATAAFSAHAAYPDKTVTIVVPFAAGGPTDKVARDLAEALRKGMNNQTIVIENVGGAGGTLGAAKVAKSAPDGYTIMLGTSAGMVVNPLLSSKLPYDALKDFAPVSNVIIVPQLLVINPQLPVKSIKDLIALAKAKPGTLNAGSSGVGTPNHLGTELLKGLAGINIEIGRAHV